MTKSRPCSRGNMSSLLYLVCVYGLIQFGRKTRLTGFNQNVTDAQVKRKTSRDLQCQDAERSSFPKTNF